MPYGRQRRRRRRRGRAAAPAAAGERAAVRIRGGRAGHAQDRQVGGLRIVDDGAERGGHVLGDPLDVDLLPGRRRQQVVGVLQQHDGLLLRGIARPRGTPRSPPWPSRASGSTYGFSNSPSWNIGRSTRRATVSITAIGIVPSLTLRQDDARVVVAADLVDAGQDHHLLPVLLGELLDAPRHVVVPVGDHESLEAHLPPQQLVDHRLREGDADGVLAHRDAVGGHDAAGAGLERGLEGTAGGGRTGCRGRCTTCRRRCGRRSRPSPGRRRGSAW